MSLDTNTLLWKGFTSLLVVFKKLHLQKSQFSCYHLFEDLLLNEKQNKIFVSHFLSI